MAIALDKLFSKKQGHLVYQPDIGGPGWLPGTRELVAHRNYILTYDVNGDSIRILWGLRAARQWSS